MSSFCYKVEMLDWSRVLIPWQDNMICEEITWALGVLCSPLSLPHIGPSCLEVCLPSVPTCLWRLSLLKRSTLLTETVSIASQLFFQTPVLIFSNPPWHASSIFHCGWNFWLYCKGVFALPYTPFYQIIKILAITREQFTFLPRGSHCVTVSFLQQTLNDFLCIRNNPVGVSWWLGFCTFTDVAGFNPWLGNWDPASCASRQKWNERKKKELS